MTTTIIMPQLGESIVEGTIGKWLKTPGDRIERDEPIVEVITDKVSTEIPSTVAGVLERIVAQEGETIPVGAEVAIIAESDGKSISAKLPVVEEVAPEQPASESRAAIRSETYGAVGVRPDAEADESEHLRASPLVKRLAREHDVDLREVSGSGAGGRITKEDIQSFISSRADAQVAPAASAVQQGVAATPARTIEVTPVAPSRASSERSDDEDVLALSPIRKVIAEHMVRSRQEIPDAWALVEADVSSLVKLRESRLSDWQRREGIELSFLPFFIRAVVESLREHPVLNSVWGGDRIILKKRINVGIAVALDDGLVVPVLRDADQRSISGLAHGAHDLVSRARAGKLSVDDLQGGTFTVNNTGALGSIMSAPIINHPQAAIVTMEAIVKRTVVVNDAIAIRSTMNLCISFDHRVLDGAQALRFLQAVKRRVEGFDSASSV